MQRVLPIRRIAEMAPYMNPRVLRYLNEGQIETFESFAHFNIIAFDWYDVSGRKENCPQILLYQDTDDLLFFCEDDDAERMVQEIVAGETKEEPLGNGQLLHRFFARLLRDDMRHLDRLETEITDTEDEVISGAQKDPLEKIIALRKELMALKRYYEQLNSILDELSANDNGLLSEEEVRRIVILCSRTERYLRSVLNLREYVAQMREAYQSQIDIQQNQLMKVFTVVTAIFLPLTLLVGWYGMNFADMPELRWRYGYPAVIALSVALAVVLIVVFKRKKWF